MSERGDSCFPGLELLARETGYSKSTVTEALAELERAGYLERSRSKGGRTRTSRYSARLPETVRQPDSSSAETVRLALGNCPGGGQEDVNKTLIAREANASLAAGNGRRDLVWEACERVFGPPANEAERSRRARAVKLFRQSLAAGGVAEAGSELEIRARRERYLERYDHLAEPSDIALASRWSDSEPRAPLPAALLNGRRPG